MYLESKRWTSGIDGNVWSVSRHGWFTREWNFLLRIVHILIRAFEIACKWWRMNYLIKGNEISETCGTDGEGEKSVVVVWWKMSNTYERPVTVDNFWTATWVLLFQAIPCKLKLVTYNWLKYNWSAINRTVQRSDRTKATGCSLYMRQTHKQYQRNAGLKTSRPRNAAQPNYIQSAHSVNFFFVLDKETSKNWSLERPLIRRKYGRRLNVNLVCM